MMYTEENFELTIPTNISFTLYKYDYIDSVIISRIFKECKKISTGKKGVYKISVNGFKQAILSSARLRKELEKSKDFATVQETFKVNSLFFLWNIIEALSNLQWLTFKISEDKNYTRIYEVQDKKILTFQYIIEEGVIRLPSLLNREDLDTFNKQVISIGIMENKFFDRRGYFWMRASSFFDLISSLEDKGVDIMTKIIHSIDPKIEDDDPLLMVITDYTHY